MPAATKKETKPATAKKPEKAASTVTAPIKVPGSRKFEPEHAMLSGLDAADRELVRAIAIEIARVEHPRPELFYCGQPIWHSYIIHAKQQMAAFIILSNLKSKGNQS